MAKILTDEEAKQFGMRPLGKKHFVRILIEQLEPGQKLLVTRADFLWNKKNPGIFTNALMKATSKKFIINETRTRTGWIVIRTE